jgi:division protein CdvB (Snf7/Vps24/ESCRT-III family)
MNQTMNLPAMQAVMMEFQRQSEIMDMKEEMMEETMDDMFETEDNEGTITSTLAFAYHHHHHHQHQHCFNR